MVVDCNRRLRGDLAVEELGVSLAFAVILIRSPITMYRAVCVDVARLISRLDAKGRLEGSTVDMKSNDELLLNGQQLPTLMSGTRAVTGGRPCERLCDGGIVHSLNMIRQCGNLGLHRSELGYELIPIVGEIGGRYIVC